MTPEQLRRAEELARQNDGSLLLPNWEAAIPPEFRQYFEVLPNKLWLPRPKDSWDYSDTMNNSYAYSAPSDPAEWSGVEAIAVQQAMIQDAMEAMWSAIKATTPKHVVAEAFNFPAYLLNLPVESVMAPAIVDPDAIESRFARDEYARGYRRGVQDAMNRSGIEN